MTSVGETLRRERERRHLELRQVSNETKISLRLLEAIEAEQFEKLPGGVFAKNFVRQYARLLGLDEEEITAELARELEPQIPQAPEGHKTSSSSSDFPRMAEWEALSDPRTRWVSSLPALGLVIGVIGLCSLVYLWWQRERRSGPESAPVIAQSAPRPQTPPAQAGAQQGALSQPAETSAAGASPGQPEEKAPSSSSAAPNVSVAAPKPVAPSPEATAAGGSGGASPAEPSSANASGETGAVHVEMRAAEPVWVLARSDGKFQFSGTMEASQSRTVDGNSTVVLRVGNAGGVAITLNGKPIGPLGPKGEPRTVEFTPGGFQIMASAPAPSAPAPNASDDTTPPPAQAPASKDSGNTPPEAQAPAPKVSGDTPPSMPIPSGGSPGTVNNPSDKTPPLAPKPSGGVPYDPL
jgi:cytoskeleton protein RodZ